VKSVAKNKKKMQRRKGTKAQSNKAVIAASQLIETQKEAAEYAGVNTRTIRRWEDEGMPKTEDDFYIRSMLDIFKANKGSQITEDKARLQSAEANYKETKAKLLEIELKIKQGQLLPLEAIEKARIARILAVKRAWLGQGRKLAKRLAALKDPRKIQALLDDENRMIITGFTGNTKSELK